MNSTHDYAKAYDALGWSLVAIPAGSKAPQTFSWQTKPTPSDFWMYHPTHNIGVLHSKSKTVALDIDHMLNTRTIFEALNIDLDAILETAPRIVGRPERGKVLFTAPEAFSLSTRKISWPRQDDPRLRDVVFELRAGSVQDVLPPSIHPDTGEPYTWAGVPFTEIGPIPPQLLTIWTEWDRFRPQMADLCPWKRKEEFRPPPKRRRVESRDTSVIDAYNDATPMAEALSKAGYKQFGNRWLSPSSSSKIPGVVIFDDGRAYSHHASDPFDPAHAFDAFEVFCQYEHLGNVSGAVKAAAEALKLDALPVGPSEEDREMMRHGASVAAVIMGRATPTAKAEVPAHLLTVPGVLNDLVTYSAKTAIKPQPQFDVQAALAFGSVVMGRRYITDSDNMTSLFFLNVAKTGTGKEQANKIISRMLEHCGLGHLRGPAGYTSEGGVLSALKEEPCHIATIDEFGNYLAAAGSSGSVNMRQSISMMMEAFGRQTGTISNRGYSTVAMNDNQRKALKIKISSPSMTVLGMTTPETFYDAIGSKDAASGLLNRFLIVESLHGYQKSRKPQMIDPPQSVADWAKAMAKRSTENILQDQGPEFPPEPVLIPFSAGAYKMFSEYEDIIIERMEKENAEVVNSMMNRCREIAMRLSLIVAGSLGDTEITTHAARWAIDYVDYYSQASINLLKSNMFEGDTDGLRKTVAAAIMQSGSAGLKMAELIKQVPRLGNLKKHERDGLLAMVMEDFPIEKMSVKPEGKGRPSIIHRAVQDD